MPGQAGQAVIIVMRWSTEHGHSVGPEPLLPLLPGVLLLLRPPDHHSGAEADPHNARGEAQGQQLGSRARGCSCHHMRPPLQPRWVLLQPVLGLNGTCQQDAAYTQFNTTGYLH